MDRKNKSPVWNVFLKDVANNRSTCSQCGKEFKYRYTTTNLRDHLKRYHPEWLPESSENSSACNNSSQSLVPYSTERLERFCVDSENTSYLSAIVEDCDIGRKNKSSVWQVFVKDADSKNVTCTLCEKEFKFWNNTTNLRAHLKRSHPDWHPQAEINIVENVELDFEEEQDELETRRSSTSSTESIIVPGVGSLPDSNSNLWKVFSKINSETSIFCALCAKECKSLIDETSMIDHMQRLHPTWKLDDELEVSNQEVTEVVAKDDSNDAVVSNVLVVPQERKNRSPVWDVFVKDPARKRTTCLLCNRSFKCFSNTANLLDHLRRIHPNWKQESRNTDIRNENFCHKRPTITRITNSSLSDNTNLKPSLNYIQSSLALGNVSDMKSKRVDKLIGEMICMDFQNLNIVEDLGFKRLIKEIVPNYNPPSRKLIVKQTLPQLYDDVSKHLHHALEKCKYVAISVELWTNHNMEGFMTLYVHYFSNEKYTSSVLHTERINTEHSSADLASVIYSILNDHWHIFNKITAIVADDDDAVKSACEMLSITHIPCVGQMINNIITEELTGNDDAQLLLQHCLNLVAHFKLNPSAAEVLRSIQLQQGLPVLNLKQVVPTRWNSALHMAQRLAEVKDPLSEAMTALDSAPESFEPLSGNDWLHLSDFIAVLKPFELMTSELSADSYCNLSKVIPLIRGVQSSLQQVSCVSDLGTTMRKSLLEKLEARFATYEKYSIPSVATLLDPRFKRAGLGVETTIESASNFVIEQVSELKNTAAVENQNGKLSDEKSAASNSGIWNFLEKKVKESQKSLTTSAEVVVKQYLDLPYYKRHECPFKFWIGQSSLEPELADIAMKFMCIPATSFPAERFYSKTGINITERRNRMTTKHFNTLIFLNKNL